MLCRCVALGALELNIITIIVVVTTVGEGGVGKDNCIGVGRVGTCRSAG